MSALTDTQLLYLHDQLGTDADEDEMQLRYDRLQSASAVVKEMLTRRLADLLSAPASFSVSGEYTQNTSDNIKALQEKIGNLSVEDGTNVVRIVRPASASAR